MSPDNHIGQTVAIHVAGAGDGSAALIVCGLPIEHKTAGAGRDCRQVDGRATGLTKHHIAAPGIGTGRRITEISPHN